MSRIGWTTQLRRDRPLGRTLGKWIVEKRIGGGGMGDVFKARHSELGRPAAIKTLSPHLAKSAEYVRRFRSEALAVGKLRHPNLVEIYDVDSTIDLHYIVMEFVEGTSLQDLLARSAKIQPHLAVRIARDVAKGLQHAHQHGIVHRDIKPGNILLTSKEPSPGDAFRVVVTDFGLCQDPDADPALFPPGRMMGTPYYIAPEQARGERADDRSDLYSLGITLFVMLTGKKPFEGRSPSTVVKRQLNDPAPPLVQIDPSLPLMLSRILNKLLQKKREDRYQIAAELLIDLEKFLENHPLPKVPLLRRRR